MNMLGFFIVLALSNLLTMLLTAWIIHCQKPFARSPMPDLLPGRDVEVTDEEPEEPQPLVPLARL